MTQQEKEMPQQALSFKNGDFVVVPDGQVGMIYDIQAFGHTGVQFGASGPCEFFNWKELKLATGQQVRLAGLTGVGDRWIRPPKPVKTIV